MQDLQDPRPEGVPLDEATEPKGWQGAMLPYAALRDDPRGEERVLEFAAAVYDIAAPLLR